MRYADKIETIKPFQVMQALARAQALESAGHHVVHLEVGEPDFDTAKPIVEAGQQALRDGRTKYTSAVGITPLREAIAMHYEQLGVTVDPTRIVVTSGASAGLNLLAALLLNPAEEMLIADPGYPCNEVFVRAVGAQPRPLSVTAAERFQPTAEQVRATWTDATRGVLFASPANPTGTMLAARRLQAIADAVAEHDGFFILDEIYQGLVQQAEYNTGLSIRDELFVLNSFSKYFGMTGWRLGWIVLPEEAVQPATSLAQNLFICPSAPAQYAALAGFSAASLEIHEARREAFARRCRLLYDGLLALGFKIPVYPDGAFYLYVDVTHSGLSSGEFCNRLLEEYHVATTPGADFGDFEADRYVRIAYTNSEAELQAALERIAAALQAWGVLP
ncbi:MAG: aminotransferase class I/II-fold pyridoxal phosphate-dependent enzyme [Pseudomonadota bacterium]